MKKASNGNSAGSGKTGVTSGKRTASGMTTGGGHTGAALDRLNSHAGRFGSSSSAEKGGAAYKNGIGGTK